MLAKDAVLAVVDREWGTFIGRLQSAEETTWARLTRLEGWNVADLARHVCWGVSMEADALGRARTGESGRADGSSLPEGANQSQILDAIRGARADLIEELDRLDEAGLERLAPMPYGDVPVPAVLQVFAMEAGVHGSDLAAAVGVDDALADDVAIATWVTLEGFLPVLAAAATDAPPDGALIAIRGDGSELRLGRDGGGWVIGSGGEPSVVVEGADSPVLLFALGRIPWDDGRLTIRGDEDLAVRFKSFFPGP